MFRQFRSLDRVDRLIARGAYPRAIDLLERQLQEDPDNVRLQQQLADLYERSGSDDRAVAMLLPLVDRFAEAGFVAKAIALLKRIERLGTEQRQIEERLASLIRQRQQEIGSRPAGRSAIPESTAAANRLDSLNLGAGPTPPAPAAAEGDARYAEEVAPIVDSPLFAGFSTRELVALIRGLGLATFEAGEILVTEGEPGNSLFVLASGSVRVYARDRAGRNRQIRTLQPPQFFGEVSLFESSDRTATVVAATSCELLRLDRATLAMIGTKHPDLPRALHRAYRRRSGSAEELRARGELERSP